jgi:hypothetical protein
MFGRFKPRREAEDVRVVADLDRMLGDLPGFRFQGRIYRVKAMNTAVWLQLCNELAGLNLRMKDSGFDRAEVRKRYSSLLGKAVDGIRFEDVDRMTDAQLGAVVQLVVECVTGKAYVEDPKKKTGPAA